MQLHADQPGTLVIRAVGEDWIDVNGTRHQSALLLSASGTVERWEVESFAALVPQHFEVLRRFEPEVVLFGSGERMRFAPPDCVAPLLTQGIGVETMTTRRACHTFNILTSEGRRVVAVLLPLQA